MAQLLAVVVDGCRRRLWYGRMRGLPHRPLSVNESIRAPPATLPWAPLRGGGRPKGTKGDDTVPSPEGETLQRATKSSCKEGTNDTPAVRSVQKESTIDEKRRAANAAAAITRDGRTHKNPGPPSNKTTGNLRRKLKSAPAKAAPGARAAETIENPAPLPLDADASDLEWTDEDEEEPDDRQDTVGAKPVLKVAFHNVCGLSSKMQQLSSDDLNDIQLLALAETKRGNSVPGFDTVAVQRRGDGLGGGVGFFLRSGCGLRADMVAAEIKDGQELMVARVMLDDNTPLALVLVVYIPKPREVDSNIADGWHGLLQAHQCPGAQVPQLIVGDINIQNSWWSECKDSLPVGQCIATKLRAEKYDLPIGWARKPTRYPFGFSATKETTPGQAAQTPSTPDVMFCRGAALGDFSMHPGVGSDHMVLKATLHDPDAEWFEVDPSAIKAPARRCVANADYEKYRNVAAKVTRSMFSRRIPLASRVRTTLQMGNRLNLIPYQVPLSGLFCNSTMDMARYVVTMRKLLRRRQTKRATELRRRAMRVITGVRLSPHHLIKALRQVIRKAADAAMPMGKFHRAPSGMKLWSADLEKKLTKWKEARELDCSDEIDLRRKEFFAALDKHRKDDWASRVAKPSFPMLKAMYKGPRKAKPRRMLNVLEKFYHGLFEGRTPRPKPRRRCKGEPLTNAEFNEALNRLRRGTAAGPDDILPEMILELPQVAKQKLLFPLINRCVVTGDIPQSMRDAVIVPLLKPGKDAADPESYRPVSLTPIFAKLVEHVIAMRIRSRLAALPQQYAYTASRSTLDVIAQIVAGGTKAFNVRTSVKDNEKSHRLLCAMIDFSKAFDSMDHDILLKRMHELGLPPHICRFVRNFLVGRRFRVREDSVMGKWYKTGRGAPQGTVLGPILWIIFIDTLCERLTDAGFKCTFLYADDLTVIIEGCDETAMTAEMQQALNIVQAWAKEVKMSVSIKKTTAMWITRSAVTASANTQLTMCGQIVKMVKASKLLGVIIDPGMSFTKHADDLKRRLLARVQQLGAMGPMYNGASPAVMRTYAVAYIYSVALYGLEVVGPLLSRDNWEKKIEPPITAAQRVVSGVIRSAEEQDTRMEAGQLLTMRNTARLRSYNFIEASRIDPPPTGILDYDEHFDPDTGRLGATKQFHVPPVTARSPAYEKRWHSWHDEIERNIGLTTRPREERARLRYAPHATGGADKVTIDASAPGGLTRHSELRLKRAASIAKLHVKNARIRGCTDGGVIVRHIKRRDTETEWKPGPEQPGNLPFDNGVLRPEDDVTSDDSGSDTEPRRRCDDDERVFYVNKAAGSGYVVYSKRPHAPSTEHRLTGTEAAGRHACSYTAEAVAMRACLRAVLQELQSFPGKTRKAVVIATDSQSLLMALKRGPLAKSLCPIETECWNLLLDISQIWSVRRIMLKFVFGHSEVPINDEADALATEAKHLPGQDDVPIQLRDSKALAKQYVKWTQELTRDTPRGRLIHRPVKPARRCDMDRVKHQYAVMAQTRTNEFHWGGRFSHRIGANPSTACRLCTGPDHARLAQLAKLEVEEATVRLEAEREGVINNLTLLKKAWNTHRVASGLRPNAPDAAFPGDPETWMLKAMKCPYCNMYTQTKARGGGLTIHMERCKMRPPDAEVVKASRYSIVNFKAVDAPGMTIESSHHWWHDCPGARDVCAASDHPLRSPIPPTFDFYGEAYWQQVRALFDSLARPASQRSYVSRPSGVVKSTGLSKNTKDAAEDGVIPWGCDVGFTELGMQVETFSGSFASAPAAKMQSFFSFIEKEQIPRNVTHLPWAYLRFSTVVNYNGLKTKATSVADAETPPRESMQEYWVLTELQKLPDWAPEIFEQKNTKANESTISFKGETTRTFAHTVIPYGFGNHKLIVIWMIWVMLMLLSCVAAFVYHGYAFSNILREREVRLVEVSTIQRSYRSVLLACEVAAVLFIAVGVCLMAVTFDTHKDDQIITRSTAGEWQRVEIFFRVGLTFCSFRAVSFFSEMPKPHHFAMVNAGVVGVGLIAALIGLYLIPTSRVGLAASLKSLLSIQAVDALTLPIVLAVALFFRSSKVSDEVRQAHYENLLADMNEGRGSAAAESLKRKPRTSPAVSTARDKESSDASSSSHGEHPLASFLLTTPWMVTQR